MTSRALLLSSLFLASPLLAEAPAGPSFPGLNPQGSEFVDATGKPIRFWGVNLVALYPDHAAADALAANLAYLGVNLARPHHNLRPSTDWNPGMPSGALLTYKETSREFDTNALDRFDYLNAALRKQGIGLALSVNWTRRYRPGDVDILPGDEAEKEAWKAAMVELQGWHWKKAFDVYKMLPVVDERATLLNEEFLRKFLAHVNPYTGLTYSADPQVLTFEIMNEASTEYAIICGNRLPDYWQKMLEAKWQAYAQAQGIEPGDLYKPANPKAKEVRAAFLRQIDEEYMQRIVKILRESGSKAPVTYSNLWRGDNIAEMNSRTSGFIEDHMYMDPLVVREAKDGFYDLSRSALTGKSFFVGELNQAEGAEKIKAQSPTRSMLPLATAAYASLQNWDGIVWFAWLHGDGPMAADGWAKAENRESNIGQMLGDGQMLDHIRTTGLMFRNRLVEKSREPFTLWVDQPVAVGDYNGLMRGKYNYKPGWQNVHGVRKAFGKVPESQATAPWMTQAPANPIVSDTGEIVKDTVRKQLTVAASQAEAFSGYFDGKAPAGLKHLAVEGKNFGTVIAVAADGRPLAESEHLILSRTEVKADNSEGSGPVIRLAGLKQPTDGKTWQLTLTRPRAEAKNSVAQKLTSGDDGTLVLDESGWRECELRLVP
jgi:hypothetical protein